jgi:S-(hydroxymethyl)glutathione dehydrogenase / alcohol dehydrogenase
VFHFQAAVLRAPRETISVEQIAVDELRGDDVLVRIKASGLCHTDLEVVDGSVDVPLPAVLGHEGSGVVESLGPAASGVNIGDHVVLSWKPSCGHCFYCVRGQPILCEPTSQAATAGTLLDGSRRLLAHDGPLNHFGFVSSHAEFAVVPARSAIVVPAALPPEIGALIGCGVATGVSAVIRTGELEPDSNVAVIGCGVVGLSAIAGARLAGANVIVAVDPNSTRLALAEGLGATVLVQAGDEIPTAVRNATAGRGADLVIEAVGRSDVFSQAIEAARPGGKVVLLGKVAADARISLPWSALMGERQIRRSSYGGARPLRDFPFLAQMYLAGRLDLDSLITSRHRLDGINQAFDSVRAGTEIRAVVTH